MNYRTIIGEQKIVQEQADLGKRTWPEFMQHDSIVVKYWSFLYTDFTDFQFALYSKNGIMGVGNSIPVNWKGEFSNLPNRGLDWAMEKAFDDLKKGLTPNLLIGVQILINPEFQSKGLSYRFLGLMKQIGKTHGINNTALPVRPSQKYLYPLISMEDYLKWINQNGEPFDSWIRVHIKAGGKIVSICSESMTIKGSINDWQEWTGLKFQCSGLYTIDKALCPVRIDLDKNTGEYIEPNVWIIHST